MGASQTNALERTRDVLLSLKFWWCSALFCFVFLTPFFPSLLLFLVLLYNARSCWKTLLHTPFTKLSQVTKQLILLNSDVTELIYFGPESKLLFCVDYPLPADFRRWKFQAYDGNPVAAMTIKARPTLENYEFQTSTALFYFR